MATEAKVIGLFLVVLAFIIFIYAAPSLTNSIRTDANSTLENETETIKNVYSLNGLLIAFMPMIIGLMGLGLLWKG